MNNPVELKTQIQTAARGESHAPNQCGGNRGRSAAFWSRQFGLDSVDALQIVVALDKNYGLKIPNPERPRQSCKVSTPSRRRWKRV